MLRLRMIVEEPTKGVLQEAVLQRVTHEFPPPALRTENCELSSLFCHCPLPGGDKLLLAFLDDSGHFLFQVVVEDFLLHDRAQQFGAGGIYEFVKLFLKIAHLVYGHVVKEATRSREDDENLFGKW